MAPMSKRPSPQASSREITEPDRALLMAQVAEEMRRRLAEPLSPGLYIVSTPIGNMGDMTLRAMATLALADAVYCEDTRQSQKLVQRFGIRQRLETYHEHNADKVRPHILEKLAAGRSIALISDAGTPLVSDPGFKLVRAVLEAGHAVTAVPGASAVLTALAVAGLPTDSFHFAGFLPPKAGGRRQRIEALAAIGSTVVLFEAPGRTPELIADLLDILGDRPAVIARELTKLNETVLRGSLSELALAIAGTELKGEVVVLVGAGGAREVGDDEILDALGAALPRCSVRDAVAEVADRLSLPRKRVYDLAIALRAQRD